MRMTILAAAVAALAFLMPATSTVHAMEHSQGLTEINIARIKSVLRLTPEQKAYWPPVEAALLSIARHQTQDESAGLVRRISHRVVAIVLDSAAIQRLATAARPLIVALNDDQRRDARALAQEMGLGPVVAALN